MDGGKQVAPSARALADAIRRALEQSRARMLELLAPLSERQLQTQYTPLLSPVVWDLAHVANYEEQWLVRALGGSRVLPDSNEQLYDAIANPRAVRGELNLLGPHEAYVYAAEVRRRALELLDVQPFENENPLTAGGRVYWMVLQHEHQHAETVLAALQAMDEPYALAPKLKPRLLRAADRGEAFHEGGRLVRGCELSIAYDNEQPVNQVTVAPFFMDRHPVTNGEFVAFIEDGGYRDAGFWSQTGFAHCKREGLEHPAYWISEGNGKFWRKRFGHVEPLPLEEPVQHLSFHEAEAYARWAGKRLPTEAEWELAAKTAPREAGDLWHDGTDHSFAPQPVGTRPDGASDFGVEDLFGSVWEWCATVFDGYPGFRAYPYREYSEAFFDGKHRVLRGGSWATHPSAIRASFRNWDYPIRRHIFAGLRCARDA
ncbi:MAG: ergothioneine biosynthesis protein EgtB [Myxococcaceae bacterium]